MATSALKRTSLSTLRPTDPELPLLASQAAIELDNLLLGQRSELESVTRLAELLKNSFVVKPDENDTSAGPDSLAVSVVSDALHSAQGWQRVVSLPELIVQASEIAEGLQRAGSISAPGSESQDPARVEKMRDFCASLCTCAAAYMQSLYELSRPPHPYRR